MKIGDLKKDKYNVKSMWIACEGCGKERWVQLREGKPKHQFCRSCCRLGEHHAGWKGGQWEDAQGYIRILKPEHPQANCQGYVKRARLVLERKLGRPLLTGMDSHHLNGIRDDDRPENLEELTRSEHMSLHRR